MIYETETLKLLRQSLDEEDETNVISILHHHHKYLREYMSMLTGSDVPPENKQATLSLFLPIFKMHVSAEQDTIYKLLKNSANREVRLEALKSSDENEIAFDIIKDLQDLNAENLWTEEIDAKIRLLSGLIKSHIKEEETILYPMAEKFFSESKLSGLTSDYLGKCKIYLDMEMESNPSIVSRTDIMTFLY